MTRNKCILTILLLVVFANFISGQKKNKTNGAPKNISSTATPCMDVLHLFTSSSVPELGTNETPAVAGKWKNGETPPNLPATVWRSIQCYWWVKTTTKCS